MALQESALSVAVEPVHGLQFTVHGDVDRRPETGDGELSVRLEICVTPREAR